MIIKNYKYDNSKDGIHYTVDVDGYEFEMNHTKTEYGSVQHDDIEYFLDEVAEYDTQEAELIEDFVRLQSYLLMYGVGFVFKNAEEVQDDTKIQKQSRKHNRKELESSGFGWVFDCEGIEVKEVEDDSKIQSVGQNEKRNEL